MKHLLFFIAMGLLLQPLFLSAQKLALDGNWKYSTSDNPSYATSGFDDTQWKEKPAGSLMFKREDLDGGSRFTWIRKTILIPASYKKNLDQTGALAIFLGRIRQADELYVNGILTGQTNSSDIKRAYILSPERIRWDSTNTIVLRIRHWGDESGLEKNLVPYIDAAKPADIFAISASAEGADHKESVKGLQVDYRCVVVNHSSKPANAIINTEFFNLAGDKLSTADKKMVLAPGVNTIHFPFTSPSSFLKIHYALQVPAFSYQAGWNDEYGFDRVVYKPVQPVVTDKISGHFSPAGLDQQIIKGWLGERMKINEEKRLYKVDEPAILAGYINKPGDHPWIGEHAGKFLDAAANTFRNAGDERLKTQLDRTVQQLIAAQLPDGYMGTYTADNYWTSWDVWSHKYNIIGLLNYYALSGFSPALETAKKAGDLLCKTFGDNNGQRDIIKSGTHVGMAATSVLEPMVDLYRYTGDKKYLDFCYYIIKSYDQPNGPKILSTLNATGGRTDKTANAKAYEMLSNFTGIIKLYKVTGDDKLLQPMLLAWKDIVASRLYITGTASSFEHFKDNADLPASDKDNMGEGCVTTTWIQVNYQLLCITGEMKYLDELERAVYNHLTGAENPENGDVSYYTPLIGVKPYRSVITCCMSSVPRGISMIPLFANGKLNNQPAFLFYQPGTYSSTAQNGALLRFSTATRFPEDGNVVITVDKTIASPYALDFRKPYWAANFTITINGKKQPATTAEIVAIKRVWKQGDHVTVNFDQPLLVLPGGSSYPKQVALQRGPLVLAFDKNVNGFAADGVTLQTDNIQLQAAKAQLPAKWIGTEMFQLKAAVGNQPKDIVLVPYADAGQTGGSITTWMKENK